MKETEAIGRTVEEAIDNALETMNATRKDVKVQVLEEGSKGFLGILGSRQARVKVVRAESPEKLIKEFLEKIVKIMNIEADIEVRTREGYYFVSINGEKMGILIGRRGDTLDALQYICNIAINRKLKNRVRVVIDIEGYRKRRELTLINLARRMSARVKETGKKIIMEPMNPQERRIIHTALQNETEIYTFSEGREPYRKVVISLRN